jgi:hypothetical protein
MDISKVTVTVHLDIDLCGEPVTHVLKMPAEIEPLSNHGGMTVHLHLDAAQLAKALYPELVKVMRQQLRTDSVVRNF